MRKILVSMALASNLALPVAALAQDSGTVQQQPGGVTTTAPATDFDWRWLLPLLAIPVVYYLFSRYRREDEEDLEKYDNRYGFAGVKGGESDVDEKDDLDELDKGEKGGLSEADWTDEFFEDEDVADRDRK